jgi:NADH dehydrogenase
VAERQLHVVTGAFSYTGSFIARRLLDVGHRVRTLTGHPDRRHALSDKVETAPYSFGDPATLAHSLRGATALHNTYWIRFHRRGMTYDRAVENSRILFEAARQAGVGRLVHISVTNPGRALHLPYYEGKARVERAVAESGLSHAIIRPTLIFGLGDILVNNIAWLLRRFPFFAMPGAGAYRLQPISGDDVAELAAEAARQDGNVTLDAAGPDTYTFAELVRLVADAIGSRARLVQAPPGLALALSHVVGWFVRDVVLTRDELDGLMAELLVSDEVRRGSERFSDWLAEHADAIGTEYASELERHFG